MKNVKHPFYGITVAAAIVALAGVACNNSDNRTGNNATPADSSTAVTNPASGATPAGQPATTKPGKQASVDGDTIDNMGHVRPATTETTPDANKQGVAKTGAATPKAHVAGVHHRERATAKIVVTSPMAGAVAPQFPGGQQGLDNYVNDHIKYPQDAIDNDVAGVVRVSFIVDENGHITKAKLINPQKLGQGLDEEALRVVRTMPEWKPGTLHGKKVKTRLELPISFQVES